MKIGIGQINPTIGDFAGNARKILAYTEQARRQGAELAVFPELGLCGYPPMDLLDQDSFVEESLKALRRVQQEAPPGIGIALGYVARNNSRAGKGLVNAVSLIRDGRILLTQEKTLLPTYDVFDEARYFEPARERRVVSFGGERLGIAICEDIWWETEPHPGTRYPVDPVRELLDQGATLLLSPSASPYTMGKPRVRLSLTASIGKSSGVPVVYVNMVGGNDSLIFDGQSIVTSRDGKLVFLAPAFREHLAIVDTRADGPELALPADQWREVEGALELGLRDYLAKTGFERVHLGLSGGIDSALVACLAARALGPERVTAFTLPSRYSSSGSVTDSERLAANLGVRLERLSIEPVFEAYLSTLAPVFAGREPDVAEENLQARIRGALLMAWSNKFSSLLLATGNKSELSTGYATLYGDMCGGLAPIGDLLKTQVYAVSRVINREGPIIPEAILTKVPSAELRHGQTDQDTLPPYDRLDEILELYIIGNLSREEIVERGYEPALVRRVLTMVACAEYKRRQAPPVLRVSPRAFGTGRRIPIARRVHEA